MSIARMKFLQVIVPFEVRRRLIKELTRAGCLELKRCDEWMQDPDLSVLLERIPSDGAYARQLAETASCLDAMAKYAGIKKSLFKPRTKVAESEIADLAPAADTLAAIAEVNSCSREIYALSSETGRLNAVTETLEPWLSCDIPLSAKSGDLFDVVFCTASCAFSFDELKARAEKDNAPAFLELVSTGKELHYMVLTVHKDEKLKVFTELKDCGFSESTFSGLEKTARECAADAKAQLENADKRKEELCGIIASKASCFEAIGKAFDYYTAQAEWDDVSAALPSTKSCSLLTGWVPEDSAKKISEICEGLGCAYEFRDPLEDEEPPTLLENGSFTAPFGQVTSLYGMPSYRSLIDPNPVVAISYFIFFGMMFSDAAYGLILFFACWWFLKKTRPDGGMKRFVTMFCLCGISTFLWGAAFGSWFGDFITVISERITGTAFVMPAALDPLSDPLTMLGLSLGLGVVHLYSGMILNIRRQLKRKEYGDIFFGELTWMILIPCVVLYAVGIKPCIYIAAVCLALATIGGARGRTGIGKFTGAFGAFYNGLTGNLSDILSYSRLMALAMSTGVIAQVMNTLGNMLGTKLFGWIFFIAVFVIGQVFNFAISILGAFVHSCRLQFVELFGKFYEGGGSEFSPLRYKTKYTEISKEA